MKTTIFLLALCQAMLVIGTSLLISTSALVGADLAPRPDLATVPLGLQFLAMMLSTFPASLLMRRFGRRAVFFAGALSGLLGAAIAGFAITGSHFAGFCLGSLLLGVFNGVGQFYRFAAADVATPAYRSRAISWVLAGGLLAAFIGPTLAAWTRQSLAVPFAGSYFAIIGVYLITLFLLSLLRIPPPGEEERAGVGRPLRRIAARPTFLVAVLGAVIGYAVMNLVMTSTPLAMAVHRHPFGQVAVVIQWHIVGMFLPSFFTGSLIRRAGVLNVMLAGGVLLLACVAINLSGTGLWHFWSALALLGVGWNFLYVGATTLLTETYTPAEKAKTQALNDFAVTGSVTLTAFSAGALHHALGWQMINIGVLPAIVLVIAATLWLRARPGPLQTATGGVHS